MTTDKLKRIMKKHYLSVKVDPDTDEVCITQPSNPPTDPYGDPLFGDAVVSINGDKITYSGNQPITDGVKKACESYAKTSIANRVNPKEAKVISALVDLKRWINRNAYTGGFLSCYNVVDTKCLNKHINQMINATKQ